MRANHLTIFIMDFTNETFAFFIYTVSRFNNSCETFTVFAFNLNTPINNLLMNFRLYKLKFLVKVLFALT